MRSRSLWTMLVAAGAIIAAIKGLSLEEATTAIAGLKVIASTYIAKCGAEGVAGRLAGPLKLVANHLLSNRDGGSEIDRLKGVVRKMTKEAADRSYGQPTIPEPKEVVAEVQLDPTPMTDPKPDRDDNWARARSHRQTAQPLDLDQTIPVHTP